MMNVATQIAIALLGCWEPVSGGRFGEVTCVTMGPEPLTLQVTTIVPGSPSTQSLLRLDGSRQPIDSDGCSGWEEARPSKDGERILLEAEVTCGSAPKQRRSAVLTITPDGEWLHAEGTGIATIGNVQLQLLRPTQLYATIPEDIRQALSPVLEEAEAARTKLALTPVTAGDLIELDDMGAADALIDVVVAAAHPRSFALGVDGRAVAGLERERGGSGRELLRPHPAMYGFGYPGVFYSDLDFMLNCSSIYGSWRYSSYADPHFCSPYSYYGNRYWDRYLGGYWPGISPIGPVVIRPVTPSAGGRVVKGDGYTRPGTTTGGTRSATPRGYSAGSTDARRTGSGSSSGATRSSSGSSRSGSTASGSTTGSSSSGRTAQPRKP